MKKSSDFVSMARILIEIEMRCKFCLVTFACKSAKNSNVRNSELNSEDASRSFVYMDCTPGELCAIPISDHPNNSNLSISIQGKSNAIIPKFDSKIDALMKFSYLESEACERTVMDPIWYKDPLGSPSPGIWLFNKSVISNNGLPENRQIAKSPIKLHFSTLLKITMKGVEQVKSGLLM